MMAFDRVYGDEPRALREKVRALALAAPTACGPRTVHTRLGEDRSIRACALARSQPTPVSATLRASPPPRTRTHDLRVCTRPGTSRRSVARPLHVPKQGAPGRGPPLPRGHAPTHAPPTATPATGHHDQADARVHRRNEMQLARTRRKLERSAVHDRSISDAAVLRRAGRKGTQRAMEAATRSAATAARASEFRQLRGAQLTALPHEPHRLVVHGGNVLAGAPRPSCCCRVHTVVCSMGTRTAALRCRCTCWHGHTNLNVVMHASAAHRPPA